MKFLSINSIATIEDYQFKVKECYMNSLWKAHLEEGKIPKQVKNVEMIEALEDLRRRGYKHHNP